MSFSFNFVIDEDEAGDNASPGASAEAQLIGTTKPAEHDNESANSGAVPDLVPGKRLVLDSDSDTSLEMKVPSSKLVIRLSSAAPSDAQEGGGVEGTELREFIKVDEERAAIGDHLLNLLYDDDTQTHKDLVPRQYEGGLKVWEASLDLVRYLHRMKTIQRHPLFELNDDDQPVPDRASSGSSEKSASSSGGKVKVGAGCVQEEASDEAPEKAVPVAAQKAKAKAPIRVLELGCGHGFPGLYVLQEANVAHCAFTDYNEAVLRTVTWPTVLVNARGAGNSAPTMDLRFRARYYAGDWDSVSPLLREDDDADTCGEEEERGRFELILTAETLYTPPICSYVERLLRRHLSQKQVGVACALVAAKRFYFGTGGSTAIFKQAVADANGKVLEEASKQGKATALVLHVETVDTVSDGLSNIRDILKVTWERRETASGRSGVQTAPLQRRP